MELANYIFIYMQNNWYQRLRRKPNKLVMRKQCFSPFTGVDPS